MGAVRSSIQLNDMISAPLMRISNALNMTISSFEEMQYAANSSFDSSNFDGVRAQLDAANMGFEEMVQNIHNDAAAQENFNQAVREGTSAASGLENKLLGMVAAYASFQTAGKVLNLSDQMTQASSRINLITDSLQEAEELQDKIYLSAERSRASYLDTADAVVKLANNTGDVFSSNDEIIAFLENVNKQFVIGGTSAEAAGAMTQLTQGLAAGALRGDELNSVLEGAPGIARAIEESMGWASGSIKQYAEDGLVTAQVVKNAMLGSTDEISKQFDSMDMTWGQVFTSMQNKALMEFEPVLNKLNELANSESFQTTVDNVIGSLAFVAGVVLEIFDLVGQVGMFISDNWSILSPIIYGVVAAMSLYAGYLAITNALGLISTGIQTAQAIAMAVKTGATVAEVAATNNLTVAQWALNNAMLASPITWILIIIIAVIAAIYAIVAAINKVTGSTISATGIIAGSIAVLGAVIWNTVIGVINAIIQFLWTQFVEPFISIIEWVLNVANGGFNSFGDAVANLIGNIISWFLSLGKVVTKIIDAIFGTDWTSGLSSLQDSVLDWGKNENAITLDRNAPEIDATVAYDAAWNAGYQFGEGIDETISNFDPSSLFGGSNIPNENDYNTSNIPTNIASVADDTGKIKDSVDISSEDLKYMRDIAERDVVNRYTTAEIKVDMSGMQNNISSDMDLDGVINYLGEGVNEAMEKAAEGVHN